MCQDWKYRSGQGRVVPPIGMKRSSKCYREVPFHLKGILNLHMTPLTFTYEA